MTPRSKAALCSKIALALIAPALFIVFLEMALRVATTGHLYLTESNPHFMSTNGWPELRPGARTWWYGCRYNINSNGFRMSREVGEKSGPRILALGDSITLGMAVREDKDVWPMQLEALANAGRTLPVEVINSGVQGWNLLKFDGEGRIVPAEFRAFIEQQGAALKPDVIVYCICMNDIPARVDALFYIDNDENKRRFTFFPERYREFMKRKAFYRLARDWYREQRFYQLDFSSIPMAEHPDIWTATEAELKRLKETAHALNANLYAVIVPYSFQLLTANRDLLSINRQWHAALSNVGIPYVDITDDLNEINVRSYYVLGQYIHMNSMGHALIAQRAWDLVRNDAALADNPADSQSSEN